MSHAYLIEGPDAAGKTTLATQLVLSLEGEGYPVVYVHNDASDAKLPGSLYRHYRAQLLDAYGRAEQGVATVIDRSYLSELVYGPVYRRRSRVSLRQARKLDRLADELGITRLARTAGYHTRRRRVEARGEDWDAHRQWRVGRAYDSWFRDERGWVHAG